MVEFLNAPKNDVIPNAEHQMLTLGGGIKSSPQTNVLITTAQHHSETHFLLQRGAYQGNLYHEPPINLMRVKKIRAT